jgi:hypothetical protein
MIVRFVVGVITREQVWCPIEQSLVEIAPLGRDELTEAICESGKLLRES